MHRTETAVVAADPDRVRSVIADLSTYPEWSGLVARAHPAAPSPGDGGDAWWVTLRARLGPLTRSKRLRMVDRSGPASIRFVRTEIDGRDHASWELLAEVHPVPEGARVTMALHYGGRLWSGAVGAALRQAVDAAVPRLTSFAAET